MERSRTQGCLLFGLWISCRYSHPAAAADARASENWQERRLFQPGQAQRRQERHGKVFIYDGLQQGTVQKAMDTNLDRVENMMFIRIRSRPEGGSEAVVVQDDGC